MNVVCGSITYQSNPTKIIRILLVYGLTSKHVEVWYFALYINTIQSKNCKVHCVVTTVVGSIARRCTLCFAFGDSLVAFAAWWWLVKIFWIRWCIKKRCKKRCKKRLVVGTFDYNFCIIDTLWFIMDRYNEIFSRVSVK